MVAIRHARPVAVRPRRSVAPAPDRRRGAPRRLRALAGAALLLAPALLVCLGVAALVAAAPASAGPPAPPLAGPSGPADELAVALQQAKLTAVGGGTSYNFGNSVAISGDTAIIGQYCDPVGGVTNRGSVEVYTRNGVGAWSYHSHLPGGPGDPDALFGCSVAISGDTAVVGAKGDDVYLLGDHQGAAYVYVRSGGNWTQQARLKINDGFYVGANDQFGCSVAISGDTIVVGAPWDNGEWTDEGAAYVFVRSGTTWSLQRRLPRSSIGFSQQGALMGASVAIAGDTIVVGEPGRDVGSNADHGAAYVYVRSGTDWSRVADLSAAGSSSDWFGSSVAVWGDTAVVGAPYHDLGANFDQGEAFVFVGWGTGWSEKWSQQAGLLAVGGARGDEFGASVAISGDTIVAGAGKDDVGASLNQGSAYVFSRSGTTWSQQQHLTASDGAADDRFGCSVAISGDSAVIGALYDDVGAFTDGGSAYVFTGCDFTPPTTTDDVDDVAWHGSAVTVHLTASDNPGGSGMSGRSAKTEYKLDGAAGWSTGTSVAVSGDGVHTVLYRSTDAAGNVEAPAKSCTVKIDTQRPSTTDDVDDAAWHGAAVTVHLTATDPSLGSGMSGGSAKTEYKLEGAATWSTGTSVAVSGDGIHTVLYRSTDAAGNLETPDKSCTVRIDTQGPTTVARARCSVRRGRTATFKYRVNDPLPNGGTATVVIKVKKRSRVVKTLRLDTRTVNSDLSCKWRCRLKKGRYRWWIYATDTAGNVQAKIGKGYLTVN